MALVRCLLTKLPSRESPGRIPGQAGNDGGDGDGRSGPAMTWKGFEGRKPVMLYVLCFFV